MVIPMIVFFTLQRFFVRGLTVRRGEGVTPGIMAA